MTPQRSKLELLVRWTEIAQIPYEKTRIEVSTMNWLSIGRRWMSGLPEEPVPRRGLRGLVRGKEMSALADSDADHNIIPAVIAEEMGLKIEGSPAIFQLGNSKPLKSLGEQKALDEGCSKTFLWY